jgi:hypothetical protein
LKAASRSGWSTFTTARGARDGGEGGGDEAAQRVSDHQRLDQARGGRGLGDVGGERDRIVGRARRRLAMAAQVDGEHVVGRGERRHQRIPGPARLGDAVDEDQGRTGPDAIVSEQHGATLGHPRVS